MRTHGPEILKLIPLFISVIFFAGQPVSAQDGYTARFVNAEDFLLHDNGRVKTIFFINIDDLPDIEPVTSQASLMPETFTLAVDQPSSDFHRFTLSYIHPTDAAYVKKILLFIGIRQIIINGKEHNLEDFKPED
ncbi:hypothetical protein [Lentimicrobium sp.]|jgi:hypothetical protein|uniref:hypothetical protein n=1 Tax=Lentimicrobium sp. TaxID=2034841 RepID=UPI0025E20F66|nr:hypothetical protein [Lentimicrobium sp.]MCO5255157.1 hypothetical protein [Lentimicrobium sp.]MCO5262857.1 hypothetical protein [Lentimicrobium sp.]HOP13136.1 hypothetical protein [Lentimicrobium sp.]HPF64247.1 hypothetical protein [Lentimicrobium sp.]HPJ60962.1 hypothetical protein [Lentimicrobium sp.]